MNTAAKIRATSKHSVPERTSRIEATLTISKIIGLKSAIWSGVVARWCSLKVYIESAVTPIWFLCGLSIFTAIFECMAGIGIIIKFCAILIYCVLLSKVFNVWHIFFVFRIFSDDHDSLTVARIWSWLLCEQKHVLLRAKASSDVLFLPTLVSYSTIVEAAFWPIPHVIAAIVCWKLGVVMIEWRWDALSLNEAEVFLSATVLVLMRYGTITG